MPIIEREGSLLLLVDLQTRLMPAIDGAAAVTANARRLLDAARMLAVPVLVTEQNPGRLGATVPDLVADPGEVAPKMTFDAIRAPGVLARLPTDRAILVAGCEAHVCVLQTVLGLLAEGRRAYVVQDAVGSRRAESKDAAIRRMGAHGAEVVTTEMVVFEWLGTCEHPRFRDALALVR